MKRHPKRVVSFMGVVLTLTALYWMSGEARPAQAGSQTRFLIATTLPAPNAQHNFVVPASGGRSRFSKLCHRSPRATYDRPDTHRGYMVHVIYLVPSDARDRDLDTKGVLDCSARAQNDWFEKESGGFRWRFDTFRAKVNDANGKRIVSSLTDVTFVRSPLLGMFLNDGNLVKNELVRLGFDDPKKRYLSFVVSGSGGACGDAVYPLQNPSPNAQWVDGKYAQVYLQSHENCNADRFGVPGAPSWAEMIAQQELIHNDGLTPLGAPHGCLWAPPVAVAHVCTGPLPATEGSLNLDPERIDVMYPYVVVPLEEKVLDQGNDDYFKHPFPFLDLEDSPYLQQPGGEN